MPTGSAVKDTELPPAPADRDASVVASRTLVGGSVSGTHGMTQATGVRKAEARDRRSVMPPPAVVQTSDQLSAPPMAEYEPLGLVELLGLLGHGVRREPRRRLVPHELSIAEFGALSGLQRWSGLSGAELARRSLVTPQAMNPIIVDLERRGFVQRRVHPSHRRILLTELTPAGRGLLRQVDPIVEDVQTALIQDIPQAECEALARGLTAAIRSLSVTTGTP